MSMANSLEVRVPFLDKEVFEVARKIPSRFKVTKENTKYAMRQAAHLHAVICNSHYPCPSCSSACVARRIISTASCAACRSLSVRVSSAAALSASTTR